MSELHNIALKTIVLTIYTHNGYWTIVSTMSHNTFKNKACLSRFEDYHIDNSLRNQCLFRSQTTVC